MLRLAVEAYAAQGSESHELSRELGMILRWPGNHGWRTHTAFQACARWRRSGGVFGDPKARIVVLVRRRKEWCVVAVDDGSTAFTTGGDGWYGTCRAGTGGFTWTWTCTGWRAGAAVR
jgi:hypothetical protein